MEKQGFIIETSCFEILSLSSILLLKPRQYPSALRAHFAQSELKLLENDYKKSLLGENDVCDKEFLGSIDTIIKVSRLYICKTRWSHPNIILQKLRQDSNRDEAIKCLSALPPKDANQTKLIRMLLNLVLELPLHQVQSESGEINLCVQYLHPILAHLFNDDDEEILLQW